MEERVAYNIRKRLEDISALTLRLRKYVLQNIKVGSIIEFEVADKLIVGKVSEIINGTIGSFMMPMFIVYNQVENISYKIDVTQIKGVG